MLSIRTQTAIAVLQDLSFDTVLQTANFLLSEGEWKDLFDKLEAPCRISLYWTYLKLRMNLSVAICLPLKNFIYTIGR